MNVSYIHYLTEEESQESSTKPDVVKFESKRAQSISELQERLRAIQSKKKLTYKEKLIKKGLKNRVKKKSKQDERNAKQKLIRATKLSVNEVKSESPEKTEDKKPVFNSEDKMVFSKFDFPEVKNKNKKKKQPKDPKKILNILEKQKELITDLVESGETKKAKEIEEKTAWKNALAKVQGCKVKDDVGLLKKSIRKQNQKKKSSKQKWEVRQEAVKKAQENKQKKRTENIEKRKKDKKLHKLKKAAKKGKIIPGF